MRFQTGDTTMIKIIAASAFALFTVLSLPAQAEESAACTVSWNKLDAKGEGYVMHNSAQAHAKAMKQAKRETAAEDRMTAKEFHDACLADVFTAIK
jgi:hypothetical protein